MQHELCDGQACCDGAEHQARARRVPVEVGRTAGFGDQRGNVLDLTMDRVGKGVAAVAAAPPIVVDTREMPAKCLSCGAHQRAVACRTPDRDQWRAMTECLVGDGGAVC